jgi:hypothetical protein
MHVQVIRAASRHQLLINARRRVGPEALILSVRQGNRKDGQGMEWEAVVAKDEPGRDAPNPEKRPPTPQRRPLPQLVQKSPRKSNGNAAIRLTPSSAMGSSPKPISNTYKRNGAVAGKKPEALIRRKTSPTPLSFEDLGKNSRIKGAPPPISSIDTLKNEISEYIRDGFASGAPPAPELLYMARRLTQIENEVLARSTADMGISAGSLPVLRCLHQAGYPERDAIRVLDRAKASLASRGTELIDGDTTLLLGEVRKVIASQIQVATMRERSNPGMVVFVGGAGVGKTGLAAKLAADLCLSGTHRPILGVLQPRRAMGVAMVRRYAEHLGIDFIRVSETRQLDELIKLSAHRPVILDSSAVSPLDTVGLQQLRRSLRPAPRAEIHAVVPATHGIQDVEAAIDAFTHVGATRISVTRLDEAPFVGRVLAAAARSQLPIGYLSRGTRIPDDLVRPRLDTLLNAVFHPQPITPA